MERRTGQQNRALHLLFTQLAEELNDHGLEVKKVLCENPVEIPWTSASVKELLWRPVQKTMLNKESTTELETKEIDKVFEVINRHIGDRFGLVIEFPSIETLILKQKGYKKKLEE